jgi:hypothetical protein
MVSLHIVYQGDDGKAISATRVNDRSLLVRAAERAIYEARDRAKTLKKAHPLIGRYQYQEVERLEKFLATLIPELEQASRKNKEMRPPQKIEAKEINHA